jgi:protein TonB
VNTANSALLNKRLPDRGLWLGLGVSLCLHSVLLVLNFKYPDASRAFQDKALDIILVNSKSARKPTNAQALAQANLDGGGNSDQNVRVRTPLPASARQQSGDQLEQAEKRVQTLESQQQRLLTQNRDKGLFQKSGKDGQPEPNQTLSGRDLASNALAMARIEGEVARDTMEYNKRPRVKQLGASAEEYRFAQYIEDWRIKVERVGTLNYPEAAKGKLYGSLRLSVRIRGDGSIETVEIGRSSGHKILDDAARRIVTMAGPYAAFPPEIRKDFEILEITRIWNFTNTNRLETK